MRQNGWKQRQGDSKHEEHTHSIQPYLEERREHGTHGCVNGLLAKHELLAYSKWPYFTKYCPEWGCSIHSFNIH